MSAWTCARIREESAVDARGCWMWIRQPKSIYPSVSIDGLRWPVHRLSYELSKGRIPEGLVVDHVCENQRCVNPDHLEAVSTRENTLRNFLGRDRKSDKAPRCTGCGKVIMRHASIRCRCADGSI